MKLEKYKINENVKEKTYRKYRRENGSKKND